MTQEQKESKIIPYLFSQKKIRQKKEYPHLSTIDIFEIREVNTLFLKFIQKEKEMGISMVFTSV